MLNALPNIDPGCIAVPDTDRLRASPSAHRPRILLLYGSLRERSYSRFLAQEAERLLNAFGAETRIFDPTGLPLPDGAEVGHPKVQELRELSLWSEGQVWTSPERHGAMSAVMKAQIDWIPLRSGPSGRRRAEHWPSCKYRAAPRASTPSIRCGYSVDGCAW